MATCNYKTQKGFPLVVYEAGDAADYDFIIDDATRELAPLNDRLTFFHIDIVDGYYYGVQLLVEETADIVINDDLTDEDAEYFYGESARTLRKRYQRERAEALAKLREFSEDLGWYELELIGVFSSGEAIYKIKGDKIE